MPEQHEKVDGLVAEPYWSIVCQFKDCHYNTFDCNMNWAAFRESSTAIDDWINGGNQVLKFDDKEIYYCIDHAVAQCSECDGPGQADHPDHFCKDCAAKDEAENGTDIGIPNPG